MEKRNATAAVIGAGDFIGAEIAKRFAAEGFTVFAGRRNGDKLAPMVQQIEQAGGTVFGRSLDARKEDEVVKFLSDADKHAPLEVCIFNVGDNLPPDVLMRPAAVANAYWQLYQQPRDAWSFEHEIRPFGEKW